MDTEKAVIQKLLPRQDETEPSNRSADFLDVWCPRLPAHLPCRCFSWSESLRARSLPKLGFGLGSRLCGPVEKAPISSRAVQLGAALLC